MSDEKPPPVVYRRAPDSCLMKGLFAIFAAGLALFFVVVIFSNCNQD